MKFNPEHHHRRSIRLKGYDYSRAGAYFITICTQDRACYFGHVAAGEMRLADAGHVAEQCWLAIPDHFPHVELDAFVIMPNHVHGIVVVSNTATSDAAVGANNHSPNHSPNHLPLPFRSPSRTIGSIVRGFKIGVTKWFRQNTEIVDVWQRNYFEHIVRDENSLNRLRQYIFNNPANWDVDQNRATDGPGTGE